MNDKTYGCRLMPDERTYLEKHYDSFSDYVHDSFKRDISLTKNNRKKNKIQKHLQNGIWIGLGIIFLFFTMTQRSLVGMIFTFLMGVFFTATGLTDMYYSRRNK